MSKYDNAVGHIACMSTKKKLALFLGTGFSKSLVDYIPTWDELVQEICEKLQIDYNDICKDMKGWNRTPQNIVSIIPFYRNFTEYPPDEKFDEERRNHIKRIVRDHIKEVTPSTEVIHLLNEYKTSLNIINPEMVFTTNFDEVTCYPFKDPKVILSNSTYNNYVNGTRIVYIHGHIDKPEDMIFFEEDFLKFNLEDKYIKKLLYTSFVENITLFIGYSLNDPNVKQILFEIAQKENKDSYGRRYLFVIENYPKHDIKHFERTFGVDVIQGKNINQLLKDIASAVEKVQTIQKDIKSFELTFLKLREANQVNYVIENEDLFIEILDGLNEHKKLLVKESLDFIINILEGIKQASRESSAFAEYKHLARYMVLLGIRWDISKMKSYFRDKFVEYFKYLLDYSGDSVGESWAAARYLREDFNSMQKRNKTLLKNNPDIGKRLIELKI